MPITKLEFKPGINREGTAYSEEGKWYSSDMVRFRSGRPEKVGGWQKATESNFKGVARVLFNWTLLDSKDCLAIGTDKKFYIEESGTFYDITPIRFTDTNTNPITTGSAGGYTHTYTTSTAHGALPGDFVTLSGASNVDSICTSVYTNPFRTLAAGSPLVQVSTTTAHGATVGDTVTFSGTTGFDGIPAGDFNTSLTVVEVTSTTTFTISVATNATAGTVTGGGTVTAVFLSRLNREFEIASVPTDTTFTFITDFPCTTGGVTGGGSVTAAFQISIGYSVNITGGGWGTGFWSRLAWGDPITSSVSGISMRIWSVDNFGEDLVFCTRDGPLYYWDATNGLNTRGVLLSTLPGASEVPNQTSIVVTTDERHVLSVGTTDRLTTVFDPLLIRWSNQEDAAYWTPAVDNTSGDQRIPLGNYVVCAISARQETLIWTDRSLHSLQFSGPPYTFSLQTLADNTHIAGPKAAINVNNITYWMGKDRFWSYSGRVQNLNCSVQRYVYDDMNMEQAGQIQAASNHSFTEVTWFYCSRDSNSVDRYVTYNYGEDLWYAGNLGRSAWIDCPGRGYPYATDGGYSADDGTLYIHEIGYDDGSTNPPSAISAYIESADFDIGDGDKMCFVDRVLPDITFTRSTSDTPSAIFSIEAKKYPGDDTQYTESRDVDKTTGATVDEYTKQVWVRLRGRQMRLRVQSDEVGVSWLLGAVRINIRNDGRQ